MNPLQAFLVGIAPQHVAGLVAALLFPLVVWLGRRLRPGALPELDPTTGDVTVVQARPRPDVVSAVAAWLLGESAAVHLALPLGHHDNGWLVAGFLLDGAGFAWLGMRAWEGRRWRLWSALLLLATLFAYALATTAGGEEPDQVGIATALIELAALALCLVPVRLPDRKRRFKRLVGSAATLVVTLIVGSLVWAGTFAAHAAAGETPQSADDFSHADHDHAHDHAARGQAGVVMRPSTQTHPTFAQQKAANDLALATKAALARYADLSVALADGFTLPSQATGWEVHLENKAYRSDGRVLDPTRPETLVYAIEGGRATLLGALFVMDRAGEAGPEVGGPLTRWHAHNVCLTLLPPGFGIVSPFGSCPALSLETTSPEMMHVWIVDGNAGGPFADGLDTNWVRTYHASHGRPFPAR